jgi:hypothetical protein
MGLAVEEPNAGRCSGRVLVLAASREMLEQNEARAFQMLK